MTFAQSKNNPGYSLVEFTKEECEKLPVDFPTVSVIHNEDLEEVLDAPLLDVYHAVECDFSTIAEAEDWLL